MKNLRTFMIEHLPLSFGSAGVRVPGVSGRCSDQAPEVSQLLLGDLDAAEGSVNGIGVCEPRLVQQFPGRSNAKLIEEMTPDGWR
jgi:hypothetical protein